MFTTRPEILGTFGVVTSTHWLASAAGMSLLERGGNAFDACVASAFVLQVVEPHLVGPAGEVPAVFYSARTGKVEVLCGQGTTPAAATLERYRAEGLKLIPGNGLLATVIPGAFDAWMQLLRDHGTMRVRDVLEPAIYYAEHGHALMPRISNTIAGLKDFFETHWPTTAQVYVPGGKVPEARKLFRNPALARTWTRVLKQAEDAGADRDRQIEAARDAFYRGFIAEEIDRFARNTDVMDESGKTHRGVITADDLAGFLDKSFSVETILSKLAEPGAAWWVADRDGEILGFANTGPNTLPHPDARPSHAELRRLYIGRDAQGLGLGTKLLKLALEWMEAHTDGPLWIGVWSGNEKAQKLYAAYGFEKAGEYDYPVGAWNDREFILRRG